MESFKDFKQNFYFYTNACITIAFILGIAYLIGFWWTVDINIFPFLSLFDLIRCSASPFLILYILGLILQSLIIELQIKPFISRLTHKLLNTNGKAKRCSKYILLGTIVLTLVFFITGVVQKISTLYLGLPIFIIITWLYLYHRIKKDHEQKENPRSVGLVLLLCFLPFISYDVGQYKAKNILDGKEYSYIVVSDGGIKNTYKFLGFVNGHYFFIGKKNMTLLINNDMPNIKLYKFLKDGMNDNPNIGFN